MNVILDAHLESCSVTKENDDPIFKRSDWASAESTFLYHVKKELQKQGHDVIKKRMWKDGHLVDDDQQYIRTRNISGGFCIYNGEYAILDAGETFNEYGHFTLNVSKLG